MMQLIEVPFRYPTTNFTDGRGSIVERRSQRAIFLLNLARPRGFS